LGEFNVEKMVEWIGRIVVDVRRMRRRDLKK